jgi:hypothetical protein
MVPTSAYRFGHPPSPPVCLPPSLLRCAYPGPNVSQSRQGLELHQGRWCVPSPREGACGGSRNVSFLKWSPCLLGIGAHQSDQLCRRCRLPQELGGAGHNRAFSRALCKPLSGLSSSPTLFICGSIPAAYPSRWRRSHMLSSFTTCTLPAPPVPSCEWLSIRPAQS